MFRPSAITVLALASGCQGLLGGVDVSEAPAEPAQGTGAAQPAAPPGLLEFPPLQPPLPSGSNGGRPEAPDGSTSLGASRPPADLEPARGDAGPVDAGSDAGPPPRLPRPVVVEVPAPLALVGVEGGDPRRGTCQGSIAIGVRPSANPSMDVFGQRLTFIEPICGQATLRPAGDATAPSSASIQLSRDNSLLSWDTTAPFLGLPSSEVPDSRLVWVVQPEALCPDAAPALVGLSGSYDPTAPDSSTTDAIRSLVIECAPLVIAPNGIDVSAAATGHQLISQADSFAAIGTASYRSACEGGSVATQFLIHSGFWLDGFVIGCSALRSPDVAGAPCTDGRECQSGSCAPEGACAP